MKRSEISHFLKISRHFFCKIYQNQKINFLRGDKDFDQFEKLIILCSNKSFVVILMQSKISKSKEKSYFLSYKRYFCDQYSSEHPINMILLCSSAHNPNKAQMLRLPLRVLSTIGILHNLHIGNSGPISGAYAQASREQTRLHQSNA